MAAQLSGASASARLGGICVFAEGVYCPYPKLGNNGSAGPWGPSPGSGLHLDFAAGHNPLILETQLVFQPPHCAAIYPVPHLLAYEDVMRCEKSG